MTGSRAARELNPSTQASPDFPETASRNQRRTAPTWVRKGHAFVARDRFQPVDEDHHGGDWLFTAASSRSSRRSGLKT